MFIRDCIVQVMYERSKIHNKIYICVCVYIKYFTITRRSIRMIEEIDIVGKFKWSTYNAFNNNEYTTKNVVMFRNDNINSK